MPLNIIVELEHGETGRKSVLTTMRIMNIGGTEEVAHYEVRTVNRNGLRMTTWVRDHHRLTEPVWTLVAKALRSAGYAP